MITGSAGAFRETMRVAWPLAAANLGTILLGNVHVAVVGRVDAAAIAAVAVGTSLFYAVGIFGIGVTFGLDPLLSQAIGRGDMRGARATLRSGLALAATLGIVLAVAMVLSTLALARFGLSRGTIEGATAYVLGRAPSLPLMLMFYAARSYLQAHGKTVPMFVGVVLANVVNYPAATLFVSHFARSGHTSLVALGAALAANVGMVVELATVLAAVRLLHREPTESGSVREPPPRLTQLLLVGFPIGLQLLAEVGAFSLATLLAGRLGDLPLAGHQVALTIASTTFQVPLALGAAGAANVGRAVGARDPSAARRLGVAALVTGTLFMASSALALITFPAGFASLISPEPKVIGAAKTLLAIAAGFQLFDGLQAVASGVLRGRGDTRFPLAMNVVGYYVVALPLGVWLATGLGWGAAGLWWGLTSGLFIVAVTLTSRFLWLTSRELRDSSRATANDRQPA